jgi:hypothetical protein
MEADYGRIGELRSALNALCGQFGFRVVSFKVNEYLGEGVDEDGNDYAALPEVEIQLQEVEI